jgi:hypothetical protein
MINEPKTKKGINEFVEEIKEISIRKHFDPEKPISQTLNSQNYLYCDPPEVILQSKL